MPERKEWPNETRTPHAVAVDRGIQAKKQHGDFNKSYAGEPNRSDVEDYDDRQIRGDPEATPPEKEDTTDYVPSPQKAEELRRHFWQQNTWKNQHRDLLSTRKVIKSHKDVNKWKKATNSYDIRGIDTQPKTLIPATTTVARKYANNPQISHRKLRLGTGGQYSFYPFRPEHAGRITISTLTLHGKQQKKGSRWFNVSLAHEIGHALDRNLFGKVSEHSKKGTGNIRIGKDRAAVEHITRTKINPYDPKKYGGHMKRYRAKREELWANWFAGVITDRPLIKKATPTFYARMKKKQPKLFKDIKSAELKALKPFMKKK